MEIRSAYSKKKRVQTVNNEPSRTKQSLADSADVNKIIKKYDSTGILQKATEFEGTYGDFNGEDFQHAMNIVADANSLFEQVPSAIRAKFKNDPGLFIDYATNAENIDQLETWGLANKVPITPETPPITPPAEEKPPATEQSTT